MDLLLFWTWIQVRTVQVQVVEPTKVRRRRRKQGRPARQVHEWILIT